MNKQDIDLLMFKFHEGLLSESESNELLSFLSNNEELKEDFYTWSQAKVYADDISDPSLEESLLRDESPVATTKSFNGRILKLLFIIGIGALFLLFLSDNTKRKIETNKKNEFPLITNKKESVGQIIYVDEKKLKYLEKKKRFTQNNNKENNHVKALENLPRTNDLGISLVDKPDSSVSIINNDGITDSFMEANDSSQTELLNLNNLKQDGANSTGADSLVVSETNGDNEIQKTEDAKSKENEKKKQKGFQRSKEFIEDNSDF